MRESSLLMMDLNSPSETPSVRYMSDRTRTGREMETLTTIE